MKDKKLEQLQKMPLIESRIYKTKDERFIVHKTIITQVKPVQYYEAVLNSPAEIEL